MNLIVTILVIMLVIALLGGGYGLYGNGPFSFYGYGWAGGSVLGVVLLILLLLLVTGRI